MGQDAQIGGPDVLTYAETLDRMAEVLGLPHPPRIPVPVITPLLSSLWIGLITPVDSGVARPLIEGLSVPTVDRGVGSAGRDAGLRVSARDRLLLMAVSVARHGPGWPDPVTDNGATRGADGARRAKLANRARIIGPWQVMHPPDAFHATVRPDRVEWQVWHAPRRA